MTLFSRLRLTRPPLLVCLIMVSVDLTQWPHTDVQLTVSPLLVWQHTVSALQNLAPVTWRMLTGTHLIPMSALRLSRESRLARVPEAVSVSEQQDVVSALH